MRPILLKQRTCWRLLAFCSFSLASFQNSLSQDTRSIAEPAFPATCQVYAAPLQSSMIGPVIDPSQDAQDTESYGEAGHIAELYKSCPAGEAVELTLGPDPSFNAFLLDPISIPPGTSLIIDGGVTVYATRDPFKYQVSGEAICGSVKADNPVNGGCLPFITLSENSGIYGYGILDGQGNQPVFLSHPDITAGSWWDHISTVKKDKPGFQEESPVMISAGNVTGNTSSNSNFVLYKLTIRNPQYHVVNLGGYNQTVWGVKVQAPWNLVNTDGFDIHASNVTVHNATVSTGDQEIAISSTTEQATSNITIDNFHGYTRGGITVLGNDGAISNIVVKDATFTGDLPQVKDGFVNGLDPTKLDYELTSYTQALPNSTGDVEALQITTNINPKSTSSTSALISNVTFQSVCIRDIVKPLVIRPVVPYLSTDIHLPVLQNVIFRDVHVLAPTPQLALTPKGIGVGDQGLYEVTLVAFPQPPGQMQYINQLTFENVVFDDLPSLPIGMLPPTSLGSLDAEGNNITYLRNAYPISLTQVAAPYSAQKMKVILEGTLLTLNANTTDVSTIRRDESLAHSCSPEPPPFAVGDLFLSSVNSNNAQSVSLAPGGSVTLNAVVQPIMTESTWFVGNSYGVSPGLLAIGSPALTNPITFFEGTTPVGTASLSANGTLATLTLSNLHPGAHTYSAQYPADSIYAMFNFGSVTVTALPPAPTSTTLTNSSSSITVGTAVTFSATVTPASSSSAVPTGSVTFADGATTLSKVPLSPAGSAASATSTLAVGSHSISATYSGDPSYAASTSPVIAVAVSPQPVADFAVQLLPGALTVTSFAPATAAITLSSVNAFNASVAFACSGVPADVTCSFTPTSLTPAAGGTASTTLVLAVVPANAMLQPHSSLITLAFSLGGLFFAFGRKPVFRGRGLLVLLVGFAAAGFMGCGDRPKDSATTSKVTVTATSGAISHSADVDLTYVKTQ